MAYFLKYHGVELTDLVKVREVNIPGLPSMSHNSIEVFEREGNLYNGLSFGNRTINIKFFIIGEDKEDYEAKLDEVKQVFYTKKERKLFCGKDNRYIWAVPVDDLIITEVTPKWAECEITLVAYDPYWYHTRTQTVYNDQKKKFIVENECELDVYPVIDVGFTKDTTFLKVENRTTGETILLGGIPTKEGTVIKKNATILWDEMESTTGWTQTSSPIDSDRSTSGTLAVTQNGDGLMAGDFGGNSNGATWHGACYKKTLSTTVEDFKVKVRMSHNSTGANGDPTRPFENDSDTVLSGKKEIYYKVNTSYGLNLRKSSSVKSTKICTIPNGTKLTGSTTKNGWLKTTYNGKTGYCSLSYLKKYIGDTTVTSAQCNYVTIKSTAIRSSASSTSKNKQTIPPDTCIRIITSTTYTDPKDKNKKFYKLAKKYNGKTGYVRADNIIKASDYEVEYEYEVETADDKTGICEIYGYSANNVQLFKMGMYDNNEYYEFTYPRIKKNGETFLIDQTVAPEPDKRVEYSEKGKTIEKELSGKFGSWNEFYGELYIERIDNKWRAYVNKIVDGDVVKTIKTNSVKDKTNSKEKLSYLVIYIGTAGDADKASGMSISDVRVKTATKIDNTVTYNFQEFEDGDVLRIDNSVPAAYLNGRECNDLIDIGSRFFVLEPGENDIRIASDDAPHIDIMWQNKHL